MDHNLKQLSDRLAVIEREVASVRRELAGLISNPPELAGELPDVLASFRADKPTQRRLVADFFAASGIEGQPIGAEALQKRMARSGLEQNELSNALLKAREE